MSGDGTDMAARTGPVILAGLLAAASVLFPAGPAPAAGVVINEVGYHMDPGGDTGKEWIELFNSDTVARDLSGHDLYPGRSPHYILPPGFVLPPRCYVTVHLRRSGENSAADLFEDTAPTANMPNTQGSVALFSGADRDTIIDFLQYGAAGQTYQATAAAAGLWTAGGFIDTVPCGHSLGLAVDGADSNRPADWCGFARPTPGYSNTPPPYDLAAAGLATEPAAVPALQPFRLDVAVANRGAGTARRCTVTVFRDADGDSLPDGGQLVCRRTFDSLPGGDTVACHLPGLPEGTHRFAVAAACSADAYRWNNCLTVDLTAGSPLVVNEVMYGPPAGRPEWIELYNRSAQAVDLHGWAVADLAGTAAVIDTAHTVVPPQGFAVVTQTVGLPLAPCPVLRPPTGLPSLNNDDEQVSLRDARGAAVDQVRYAGSWGGGGGLSLERINPFLASSEAGSWGGCVAPALSTPGMVNSVFVERPAAGAALDLGPNPFSPDGDGHEDNLIVSLQLEWPRAAVTVRIYDRLGRLVRSLAQDRELPGTADLVWNGRDERGEACPIGLYVVSLEARDVNGGGAVRKARTVAVARKL
ncbi:MAG: lamin tail domain-containing protein [Candidatus Edwardsbacteria bacterium]|jgi:hypothetical protein|nr:lamin tail domain-containing protein [Candidatus Edwardsbacteria bacterium]